MTSTLRGSFALSIRPEFDVPELIKSLDQYPYGCTEQTVSRALPLLYLGEVAAEWDKELDDLSLHRRVDHAIQRALARQTYNGSFSTWNSNGETSHWLSAYTIDFLTRAQEKGYDVPEAAYEHGVKWLKDLTSQRVNGPLYAQAYAYYVLARIGEVRASDVRYFAESNDGKFRTRLAYGQVAAALAILGEHKMAEDLYAKALAKRRPKLSSIWDYGSDMRDAAALAALISETAPDNARLLSLAEALEKHMIERRYLSTQEKAWVLLATHAMSTGPSADMTVAVNGKTWGPTSKPARWVEEGVASISDMTVENQGDDQVRYISSLRGVPSEALPAEANGFEIRRSYFDVDGNLVDAAQAKQHDLMVVLIEGKATTGAKHEALVVDMLPAGFEIENAALGGKTQGAGSADKFRFLPQLTYKQYEDARDDRYVAAIDLKGGKRDFAVAYLVRAVTPGTYKHPAPFIEDMYKPEYFARGDLGEVTVSK